MPIPIIAKNKNCFVMSDQVFIIDNNLDDSLILDDINIVDNKLEKLIAQKLGCKKLSNFIDIRLKGGFKFRNDVDV